MKVLFKYGVGGGRLRCHHVGPVECHEGDDVVIGADHAVPEGLDPRQHEQSHPQKHLKKLNWMKTGWDLAQHGKLCIL